MDHISKITSASTTQQSVESSGQSQKAKPAKLAQNLCDTLSLKMAEIYGHRWTASFGERIDQNHAWASVLAGMTGAQIATGLNHLVSARLAWPPTAPEFLSFCEARPTAESLGLPRVEKAFQEACNNTHPSARNHAKWSHECVYHAASETGFYELNTMKAEQSRRLFARNYEIAVRDFVDGKPMRAIPLALPESIPAERDEETAAEAIKAMRAIVRGDDL